MADVDYSNLPYEVIQGRILALDAQVQFLVDYMNDHGMLEEHCFTFPDGETVWATQVLTGENDEHS